MEYQSEAETIEKTCPTGTSKGTLDAQQIWLWFDIHPKAPIGTQS